MLYALGSPAAFVILVLSFVAAVTISGAVTATLARGVRGRRQGGRRNGVVNPRSHLDAFGSVSAAISGLGWARPADAPVRGARSLVPLAGTLANLAVGTAALSAVSGMLGGLPPVSLADLQRGVSQAATASGALYLFGVANLGTALLSLVPLPPLAAGRVLFARAPRSSGWQRANYWLVEQNVGTAVLLALLLVPLGGPRPVLPTVLDAVLQLALRPIAGG